MNPLLFWIVDDDPYYSPALGHTIENEYYGCTVERFNMGDQLIEALRKDSRPDVIVLDMMLPMNESDTSGGFPPEHYDDAYVATGTILAEKIKAAGLPMQIILVITALYDDRFWKPLIDLGIPAEQIMAKPAKVVEIKRLLNKIASRSKAQRSQS